MSIRAVRCALIGSLLTIACSHSIDPELFDRSCEQDSDCVLLPFDNVCGGCGTDAVSSSDQSAEDAIKQAQSTCLVIEDCLSGAVAICADGRCTEQGPGDEL